MAIQTYTCLWPVDNGVLHVQGATIQLDDALPATQQMVLKGTIELSNSPTLAADLAAAQAAVTKAHAQQGYPGGENFNLQPDSDFGDHQAQQNQRRKEGF